MKRTVIISLILSALFLASMVMIISRSRGKALPEYSKDNSHIWNHLDRYKVGDEIEFRDYERGKLVGKILYIVIPDGITNTLNGKDNTCREVRIFVDDYGSIASPEMLRKEIEYYGERP